MQKPQNDAPLAERLRSIGISESYAWQIANETRRPSLRLALRIHRELGIKLGPISGVLDTDIPALERIEASRTPTTGEAA